MSKTQALLSRTSRTSTFVSYTSKCGSLQPLVQVRICTNINQLQLRHDSQTQRWRQTLLSLFPNPRSKQPQLQHPNQQAYHNNNITTNNETNNHHALYMISLRKSQNNNLKQKQPLLCYTLPPHNQTTTPHSSHQTRNQRGGKDRWKRGETKVYRMRYEIRQRKRRERKRVQGFEM